MGLLLILTALVGFAIFVYSLFEVSVYGQLFFDRDYYCITRFRSAQKATDLSCALHNITKGGFGIVILIYSLINLRGTTISTSNWIVITSFFLMVLDAIVSEVVIRKYKLQNLRDQILTQWETQKTITKDNDHEVNIYRATVRVLRQPAHICIFALSMFLFLFTISTH